ncbi:organic hydroperoxide resistance protein [Polymorphobacter fuscus]|uniref:Ohr family peroxiredoxin n=1 Tax=Sandarakinorhabdus fusca TaxID=1439888 RepID=A0A7C9GPR3_9SPHN|nr:organic hydroperoxide resistance protein [Polymorphobacter fuscus]KAB7646544.1 organic hydroperoxide resistance protein [Polymorphobacter fuscus]MQT17792.1 Ohr family peroxiredoxin [Polymorphobacter fuscus]NJC09660.1 Ohr subfamily peroxiredoxin [Polymorphobacter fuscus]
MAYKTTATTRGGRDGRAILDGGTLALAMALPKDMGGAGDGHNPEQLFALGYSSCFGSAILAIARQHGVDGQKARVTAEVTIDKDDTSFGLSVAITVSIPGEDRAKVEEIAHAAHQICPYSKATRGNIPVTVTVA